MGRVLGIIGCYGISDQILYLVDRDEEIRNLFIVNNLEGLRFVEKLKKRFIKKNFFLIGEDGSLETESEGFSVLLWLNPEDLHNMPAALQLAQEEILTKMSSHVDSILFCYGLCRSTEERIKNLIKRATVPVTFLTDSGGEIVDDCFAAIIGGRKPYLWYVLKNKGTLFATSGYVEAWKRRHEPMDIISIVHEVEQLKYMFEAMEYHRVIELDDGVADADRFQKDVRAFTQTFEMELVRRECRLRVFEQSYDRAKEKLSQPDEVQGREAPRTAIPYSEEPSSWQEAVRSIALEGSFNAQLRTWAKERPRG